MTARVAVVTGGTRGIGKAISIALSKAGYRVAANYGGDDGAAKAFSTETGIPTYKFDVGNFEACKEGVAKIVKVYGIAPGYGDTDMVRAGPPAVLEKIIARIPVGRLGRAEDIARSVMFLIADDADFITGSTISVNGGQHMY